MCAASLSRSHLSGAPSVDLGQIQGLGGMMSTLSAVINAQRWTTQRIPRQGRPLAVTDKRELVCLDKVYLDVSIRLF